VATTVDRDWERFRASPSDTRAFEAIQQHLFLEARWTELVALYADRLADPGVAENVRERTQLYFRRAQIQVDRLGDADGALESLTLVLRDDPQHRPALSLMRRTQAARGCWDVALQVAEVESELPIPPGDRCALLCEMGKIWLERLGDPQQALATFERALAAVPEDDDATCGSARALERIERFAEAAELWERLGARRRGAERAKAHVALAKLAEGPLGQAQRARTLYRAALGEDPHDSDAIAAVLEEANERGQWPVVADLLERQFESLTDASRRGAIAARLARVLREQLGNPVAARNWFARATEHDCADPEAFEALADFERENGNEDGLRSALDRALELRGDAAPVSLLLEVASLHSEAGEEERALTALQQAVNRAPDDALALLALSDSLARLGRDEELVDLLEQRAINAGTDATAIATSLAELGALHEERLDDFDAARHAYERAFVAHPAAPDVADALERLYRKAEDWEALRDLFEVSGRIGAPLERSRAFGSLGSLHLERFESPDAAECAFLSALNLNPRNQAAHRGMQQLARERDDEGALVRAYQLEASITDDPARLGFLAGEISRHFREAGDPQSALPWLLRWADALPDDVSAQLACADGLEQLGRFDDLARTLAGLDELLPPDARPENRQRLGAAHAAAGNSEAAVTAYRSSLELAPRDPETLTALVAHLESAGRFEELAPLQRELATELPAPERTRCLESLSRLLEDRLGDVTGAIDVLQELAGEESGPVDTYARLERLLEQSGRFEELADALGAHAALLERTPEASDLELRRARILLERLGRSDAAIEVLRGVWRRDPEIDSTHVALERALRDAGRPAELADFLSERIQRAPDPRRRDEWAFERASLLADELDSGASAEAEFRRLAETSADPALRRRASARREDLLERQQSFGALREHLEAALDSGDGNRLSLHSRIARLCRDRLGDVDAAVQHFHAAARLAPRSAELWQALGDLCEASGRNALAIDALEAEIATHPNPDRELSLRTRAVRQCTTSLGDGERAALHCERILELDPSNAPATDLLVERCLREGNERRAQEWLESRLIALDGAARDEAGAWADQRAALRIRIAELLADALDDVDGAVAILEPALSEVGPQPLVATPLAELYRRAEWREERADLCRRVADECSDDSERAEWRIRLGNELNDAGRLRDAAEAFRLALMDRPDDREVRNALCALYRRLRDFEPLARLLEVELSHVAGSGEIPLRLELAEILQKRLDRPGEALEQLGRVLELDPGRREALEPAIELARSLERFEWIDSRLAAALDTSAPPSDRAAWWSQRASIEAEFGGSSESAATAYREALRLDPSRTGDRTALRALLTVRSDWPAVLDCLDHETDAVADRAERLHLAVQIAWEHISPDAALPWLERLLAERPDDTVTAGRISQVHRRAGRWEALLQALEREAALTEDPHAIHRECAEILETKLHSPARAIAAREAALACAPTDTETLSALDRLYRQAGLHSRRAVLLETAIEHAPAASRVSLHCDVAALYADQLAAPERAVRHLLCAVAESRRAPILGELLRALGRSLRAAGWPEAWARCAEEELRTLDPTSAVLSDRRRELQRDLAECYERELGRPDAALRHLRPLIELKWTDSHGAGAEERSAIEGALLRLLRQQRAWIELADRLARHLVHRPDDVDAWRELARLREERLHSPSAAVEAHRALLAHRPDDAPAVEGWQRCSEIAGDWEGVAAAIEHRLEHTADATASDRAHWLRNLGDAYWNHLHSTTRASRAFAGALEADPSDLHSLRALQRLLEAMEDWNGALDLYESEVEMLGEDEPSRRREASLRAGEIARDHTGNDERALRAYERAAAVDSLPARRQAELAELHFRCGDAESFVAAFAAWCEDASEPASGPDYLRLSGALEELERPDEAAPWAERAVASDPDSVEAWNAAGRLREACGDGSGAVEALARAAALLPDAAAAERLHRAAGLVDESDAEAALALLRAAANRDPGNAEVCASLARKCAQCGRFGDAAEFAGRALALAETEGSLTDDVRMATALAGARAARSEGDDEEAARLYSIALATVPDHVDALSEYGDTLASIGDMKGVRAAMETLLESAVEDERRPLHLTLHGAALAAAGEPDAASDAFDAAIALDPTFDRAHEELVRLLDAVGQGERGVACLERWADATGNPKARAEYLLRAANWELRREGCPESAERQLRSAVDADPTLAPAWEALATLLWNLQRWEEAFDVATAGLDAIAEGDPRGGLALIRARAIERRGDRAQSAEAFGLAAESNPGCVEAALSHARLLRGLGEWESAARALRRFADDPRNADTRGLADVLQQWARLLAGPLEDVNGAIDAYRRAVAVESDLVGPRAALAEFLSHRPDDRTESLEHLRSVLASEPTHTASLRVVLRMARERDRGPAVAAGVAILRALGSASPQESALESTDAAHAFKADRKLDDPLGESVRRIASVAADDLASALQASTNRPNPPTGNPAADFRAALMNAEAALTAPALIALDEARLLEVLTLTAALALEPTQVQGDGQLVNALSAAIRRRTRRRIQRLLVDISLAEIAALDVAAWRREIRALAAVDALNETGCDLRTALTVLIDEESDHSMIEAPETLDLAPFVAADSLARSFLRRIVLAWLKSL